MSKYKRYFLFLLILLSLHLCNTYVYANNNAWAKKDFFCNDLMDIAEISDTFVLASNNIYASKNGISWDHVFSHNKRGYYHKLKKINNKLIAYGNNVSPIVTEDGFNWAPLNIHEDIPIDNLYFNNTFYLCVTQNNKLLFSNSLYTWDSFNEFDNKTVNSIKYCGSKAFVELKQDSKYYYYVVNEDLTLQKLKNISSLDDLYYDNTSKDFFKIVKNRNYINIYTSKDILSFKQNKFKFETINNKATFKTINNTTFLNIDDITYTYTKSSFNKINCNLNFNNLNYSGKYFYSYDYNKNLSISENSLDWNNHLIDLDSYGKIRLSGDTLFVISPSYDQNTYLYKNLLYKLSLSNINKPIPSLKNNTNIYLDINNTKLLKLKPNSSKMLLNDGNIVDMDPINYTCAIVENGTTIVPIRPITTALAGSTTWDSTSKKIIINCNNKTLTLKLDSDIAYIDNDNFVLPVKVHVVNNLTVVPIRPIIEKLGYNIKWLPTTNEILIIYY